MPTIVNKWKGFCGDGLPPIKEAMGGNLIDRSMTLGYGDPASSTLEHVVCEEAWAKNSPRRAFIRISGAGDHRRGHAI
jgi:hypothetical protein